MTFSEFIGIKCANLDIETGEKMEHRAIYQRAVERFGGLETIKPLIPFSLEQIKKALESGDEHLNTLPIKEWDFASGFVTHKWECKPMFNAPMWKLYWAHGVTSASNAQGVCLLKEAARMWAEDETRGLQWHDEEAMQEIQ